MLRFFFLPLLKLLRLSLVSDKIGVKYLETLVSANSLQDANLQNGFGTINICTILVHLMRHSIFFLREFDIFFILYLLCLIRFYFMQKCRRLLLNTPLEHPLSDHC